MAKDDRDARPKPAPAPAKPPANKPAKKPATKAPAASPARAPSGGRVEDVDRFMAALQGQESGGNPSAQNSRTGAYGLWQILPSNWPSWAAEAGLGRNAPQTPENQRHVARFKMQQYFNQFGSWEAVAVAWYAGPGAARAWLSNPNTTRFTRKQGAGNEPSINEYVNTAMSAFGRQGGAVGGSTPIPAAGSTTLSAASAGGAVKLDLSKATDEQIIAEIRKTYGYLAAFLDIPEVRKVLLDAARDPNRSKERLQGALFATKWWQQTSQTQRDWLVLTRTDPATARQLEERTRHAIAAAATNLGVTLSAGQVNDLAAKQLRLGWSDQQIKEAIGLAFTYPNAKGAEVTGVAGATVAALKDLADDYLVPLSQATLSQWVAGILAGRQNVDTFKEYLVEQAKSQHPHLAAFLDSGGTVRQYADPYVERAAQLLELNPADVKLTDPKWFKAFGQTDPKTGERIAMSLSEWDDYLRGLPEYARTDDANRKTADLAEFLGHQFERVA